MKNQWFHPIEWPGWDEKELLRRTNPPPTQVPDNAQESKTTLLYGPRGESIVVRQPRPVGFRQR